MKNNWRRKQRRLLKQRGHLSFIRTPWTFTESYVLFFCFKFYFYFILLYNTVLLLPYIDMNPPRVYMSSQSWTSFPPPTPYHLFGSSPCTSRKHPVSCIEHRRFVSYIIAYMFQWHSPKSSHPLLSLTVQKSVLYICVSFAVSHTGLSLPSF